nr:MAG TPA: hypothetical protein [Caudoviricetes sp.]
MRITKRQDKQKPLRFVRHGLGRGTIKIQIQS